MGRMVRVHQKRVCEAIKLVLEATNIALSCMQH
jgi:hypothetical protein